MVRGSDVWEGGAEGDDGDPEDPLADPGRAGELHGPDHDELRPHHGPDHPEREPREAGAHLHLAAEQPARHLELDLHVLDRRVEFRGRDLLLRDQEVHRVRDEQGDEGEPVVPAQRPVEEEGGGYNGDGREEHGVPEDDFPRRPDRHNHRGQSDHERHRHDVRSEGVPEGNLRAPFLERNPAHEDLRDGGQRGHEEGADHEAAPPNPGREAEGVVREELRSLVQDEESDGDQADGDRGEEAEGQLRTPF